VQCQRNLPKRLAARRGNVLASGYSTIEDESLEGLTGGQLVSHSLIKQNVQTVFGYSGGANLPVLDTFHDSPMKFIMNRSEQCCGHAAEGYAKSTGRTGVILTTSGPGLTNIITPLQDAKGDSVPIVALSGQVPTSAVGTDAFQECSAVDLTRPCTKWSYQIQSVEEIDAVIAEAFAIANDRKKGPVHLDLPKDVMTGTLQGAALGTAAHPEHQTPNEALIAEVAAMINKAEKPLIIAGQGIIDSKEELTALANAANIPVTTTLHAMGVFDELDPKSMHMLGMHGAAYANYAVQDSDLIIAIGSRFDDRTTGAIAKYAPKAIEAEREGRGGIIHFDIEKSQFGRIIQPTLSVEGDAHQALQMLKPLVEYRDRTEWLNRCLAWKDENPFRYDQMSDGRIKTQQVIEALHDYILDKDLHDRTFVSTGVGNHQMMSCQFYRWRKPRSIVTSGSLGTMGFGLPAAIGIQVGNPDDIVLLIDGDGSFNMTLNDLGTVMEHNLPIKMAIMNDNRQQMVHVWQRLFFDGRCVATDNTNPDFCKLAESYGIKAVTSNHVDTLADTVREFFEHPGPCLGDFRTVPDICLPMVAPGKALDEMHLFGDFTIDDLATSDGGGTVNFVGTGQAPS